MLAFPDMLIGPAKEAGMNVPDDVDNFDSNLFPHFHAFCLVQLGSPLPNPTSHWHNAKVIAAIPEDKLKTITLYELVQMGFETGYSIP